MTRILVTGAGGFIGHHLVARLKHNGDWVRGADLASPEYEPSAVAGRIAWKSLRAWTKYTL
jgi:nucleoside-diphosphate-sugar epimerase